MRDLWPDGYRAAVTITFDGGYASSVEHAIPLLAERGLPSTWFLVSESVGRRLEGRPVADRSFWRSASPALVEVGNHSRSHPLVRRSPAEIARRALESPGALLRGARRSMTRSAGTAVPVDRDERAARPASLDAAIDDFARGKEDLEQMVGREVPAFAYPNGRARDRLARGVAGMGHTSARTSSPGANDPARTDLFAVRARTWTRATSVGEPEAWLQSAIRSGSWLVEVFHVVDEDTDFYWSTPARGLAGHLDALADAGVWVATQTAVADHLRGRAVAGDATRGHRAR